MSSNPRQSTAKRDAYVEIIIGGYSKTKSTLKYAYENLWYSSVNLYDIYASLVVEYCGYGL